MIILEKTINYFLKNEVKLKSVAYILNQAGIINTYDESLKAVKMDVPTIRPDLNCVLGALIEISALTDNAFSYSVFDSPKICLEEWDIKSDRPIFIGRIKRNQIKENIPEIKEMLIHNKLYTRDKYKDLIHFCALFFGVPPMLVSEKRLGKKIIVKENTIYGYETLKWGDPIVDSEEDDLCLLVLLADPARMKNDFDRKKKKPDNLYYYYIRRGNSQFAIAFFQFMRLPFQKYQLNENVKRVPYEFRQMEEILGIGLNRDEVTLILCRFGYHLTDRSIDIPQWRTDVQGSQEIAQDIFRVLLAKNGNKMKFDLVATAKDDYSYYCGIMKLKVYYSDHGFVEVISRPFIDEQELEEIQPFIPELDDVVKIINPLNRSKNIILPSLLVKLRKNLNVNDRIFEVSMVKYKREGVICEKNIIGVAGKYKNGDSITAIIWDLQSFTLCGNNRIIVLERNSGYCIWKLVSGDRMVGTVVLQILKKNKVIILLEKEIEGNRNNGKEWKFYNGLVRELSIDLPLVCPFQELENNFFNINREVINYFRIKESRLYRINDIWMVNYLLQISWKNIKSVNLPRYNSILMKMIKELTSKYSI